MSESDTPRNPELGAFVMRMLELQEVLHGDTAEALELFKHGTHEFCARMMVRALSAEFEAQIYLLERLLVGLNETSPETFELTSEEIHVFKGQIVNIKPNGKLSTASKYYPFSEHLLFVLKVASRVINPAAKPDTYNLNWESVKEFNEIRNRITHPKTLKDLEIKDEDIDHLNRAQDWIRDSMKALFNAGGYAEAFEKAAQQESNKT